ncbi:MAG TPA: zinc ribbon domain-containing protein [Pyrinomonadaceae bacterium]|nr:zinc ribbon domain-containing protein [Pyrinomonadaceae bacterium]
MKADYSTTISDHDVTLAIPGDVATVRLRLVEAVQKVGYKVMGEQPLYAKRGSQCSASWDCSLNALDYPTTLTVSLKQTNDAAVLATFNYEVKSYVRITKGDRQTLAREAEAVAALATERSAISACRACGTQVTDESHFCRRCGAPLVFDVPEVEVLRLTRNTRGSYHNILFGTSLLLVTAAAFIIVTIIKEGGIYAPLFWTAVPLAAYALFLMSQGTWQLHRTLNPKTTRNVTTSSQPAFKSSVTTALPPANVSVTEVTTSLLRDPRAKEPVQRKDANTAEFDTDQLM